MSRLCSPVTCFDFGSFVCSGLCSHAVAIVAGAGPAQAQAQTQSPAVVVVEAKGAFLHFRLLCCIRLLNAVLLLIMLIGVCCVNAVSPHEPASVLATLPAPDVLLSFVCCLSFAVVCSIVFALFFVDIHFRLIFRFFSQYSIDNTTDERTSAHIQRRSRSSRRIALCSRCVCIVCLCLLVF